MQQPEFLTAAERERRNLERLEWWVAAIRACGLGIVLVVAIGGVVALGPLLLQVAR